MTDPTPAAPASNANPSAAPAAGVLTASADGATSPADWLGSLPDDLKSDTTLSKYRTLEDFARGHLETKRLASSRLSIPSADAPPEAWAPVWDALGRPTDPKDYEIALPEGESPELADAFRPLAHQIGLSKAQAKAIVDFNNARISAAREAQMHAQQAASQAEVDAFRQELGAEADAKLAAAKRAFARLSGDAELAEALDAKLGSKTLLKFFVGVADAIGEHGRVDGAAPAASGLVPGADPEAEFNARTKDPEYRKKLTDGDPVAKAEYERLRAAAIAAANAKRTAPQKAA